MPDRRDAPNDLPTRKPPPNRPNKPADSIVSKVPAKRPRVQYAADQPAQRRKPYGAGNGTGASKQASTSATELRSKIRDTKRLLKRVDKLPADVRVEKERAIVEYERELARIERRGRSRTAAESKRIKKYHFVRFMEQKHAERLINRLDRERSKLKEHHASPEELANIEAQIQVAHVDLNYARYFPLMEKYVSLYPKQDKTTKQPEEHASNILGGKGGEKPPVWYLVQQCMEDGTLSSLRNGKLVRLSGGKVGIAKRDGDGEGIGDGNATTSTPDLRKVLEENGAPPSSIAPAGNTLAGNGSSGDDMNISDNEDKNDGRAFFDI